jgi:hypothetical protein
MKNSSKYESAPTHVFTSFPETHSNLNDNEDMEKVKFFKLFYNSYIVSNILK